MADNNLDPNLFRKRKAEAAPSPTSMYRGSDGSVSARAAARLARLRDPNYKPYTAFTMDQDASVLADKADQKKKLANEY